MARRISSSLHVFQTQLELGDIAAASAARSDLGESLRVEYAVAKMR